MSRSPATPAEQVYLRLVADYQSAILNYIYRLVGDPDVAEDLTQETYIKAWRALERLDLDVAAEPRRRAWLYRIAHNTATDHLRRRGRLKWLSLDAWRAWGRSEAGAGLRAHDAAGRPLEGPLAHGLVAEDPATRLAAGGELRQALASLTAEQRQVLWLFTQAGLNADEVAEVLGIQSAAARKRHQRAREAFQAAWDAVAEEATVEEGGA